MEFSFSDIPVTDAHIHFGHPERMGDLLAIMGTVPMKKINIVSTPDAQQVNHNPALIYFKAHHPDCVYTSGGLDYVQIVNDHFSSGEQGESRLEGEWERIDAEQMSKQLAAEVTTLKTIGFDGLKLIEGKPTVRKMIPIPLNAPHYEEMWATLERLEMPVLWHVADPEEFWDPVLAPSWARDQGWFYGDGTFPTKEELYGEVDDVLTRHPNLKVIFAHFFFLSADLPRAGKFLDAHPRACFDLTPGSEMYINFTPQLEATREFFSAYQDRLIYGTDIASHSLMAEKGKDRALATAWMVRKFLESDGMFQPPDLLANWRTADLDSFRGLGLARDILEQIYHENFERLYGTSPAPLDCDAAVGELERMTAVIDARTSGGHVENTARQVVASLSL